MDWSFLSQLAPELVIVAVVGLVLIELSRRASPLVKAMVDGINATVKSYESVSSQQAALFDRLDKLNQREIGNLQKDVDSEKIARADLERRLLTAQQELGALRNELDATKRELLEEKEERAKVAKERDILADRVKTLEADVVRLQKRLDEKNHAEKAKINASAETSGAA